MKRTSKALAGTAVPDRAVSRISLLAAAALLLVAVTTAALAADAPAQPADVSLLTAALPAGVSHSEAADMLSGAIPTAAPAPAIPDGYRIWIPRLRIDLQIREGDFTRDITDQRTPENFAFHLPGTRLPGEIGNTYLYAHARQGMFLSLWNARAGDEVFVSALDGRIFVYVVRDVLPRVPPSDVSVTRDTSDERLTLQTSTGPNGSDPRFVVVALPRGF